MNFDNDSQIQDFQPLKSSNRLKFDDDTLCLIIAILQVVGGIVGIGFFIYQFGAAPHNFILTLLFAPLPYSIYAGVLLWQGKVKGLNHSIIVQAIQIPKFMFSLIGYYLFLGVEVNLGWFGSTGGLNLNFGYGSGIYINPNPDTYGAGINLIALAAFLYLWYLRRKFISAPSPQYHSNSREDSVQ